MDSHKKLLLAGLFVISLAMPSILFAQGYTDEYGFKQSYSSIPTEVTKGENFTVVLHFENVPDPTAQNQGYILQNCMIQSGFADGRDAGEPAVDFVSGYAQLEDGSKYSFTKTGTATMPVISFDVNAGDDVWIKEGKSATASFVLSTSKSVIKETDEIYLNLSCGYKGDFTQMELSPGVAVNPPHISIVPPVVVEPEIEDVITGNDMDEHGCIPSAGTQWCESLQKCYRSWEEDCPVVTPTPEPEEDTVLTIDLIEQVQDSLEIYFDDNSTLDAVTNFNITDDEFGIIAFSSVLDFSEEGVVDELNNLKNAVFIDEGIIDIDTTKVSALADKPAMITMNGLSFIETPRILVDGKEDAEGIISNIQYDLETGTLTFDVTHFTRFEAVASEEESVKVEDTVIATDDSDELTLDQERQIFTIALSVVLAVTVPAMVLLKKWFVKEKMSAKESKKEEKEEIHDITA